MFRCGILPLHIETGRFARPKLPVEQRTCFHCTDSVEDELHFLIDCPFYDGMRCKIIHKAQQCNRDFIFLWFHWENDISTESCQYAANSLFNTISDVSERENKYLDNSYACFKRNASLLIIIILKDY